MGLKTLGIAALEGGLLPGRIDEKIREALEHIERHPYLTKKREVGITVSIVPEHDRAGELQPEITVKVGLSLPAESGATMNAYYRPDQDGVMGYKVLEAPGNPEQVEIPVNVAPMPARAEGGES
jgi:hypothetical protein